MKGAFAFALGILLAACGGETDAPHPRAWRDRGDALAAEGRWDDAAEQYRLAFALVDPVPARQAERAYLALRRAIALARSGRALDARSWLERAERLDPDEPTLFFERGRLLDGEHPATVDPRGARDAYERFLALWEARGEPVALEGLVAHARQALERLQD